MGYLSPPQAEPARPLQLQVPAQRLAVHAGGRLLPDDTGAVQRVHVSGGGKLPKYRLAGENSQGDFTWPQKYF